MSPPFTLSFWRWAIALLILLPFGIRPILAEWSFYRKHWLFLVVLGLLSIAAYNTLQYWALAYTGAINVAVIGSIMPGGIFLLTWMAGQERANAVQLLGLLFLLAGVLAVVLQGRFETLIGLSFNIGDVAILVAVAMFCLYSVLLRRLPGETNQIGLLTVLVAVGVVGIAPFHAWEAVNKPSMRVAWESFAIIGYVGLFPSVLAYLFWNRAIALAGANLAAVMMNLTTVFVSVIARSSSWASVSSGSTSPGWF